MCVCVFAGEFRVANVYEFGHTVILKVFFFGSNYTGLVCKLKCDISQFSFGIQNLLLIVRHAVWPMFSHYTFLIISNIHTNTRTHAQTYILFYYNLYILLHEANE